MSERPIFRLEVMLRVRANLMWKLLLHVSIENFEQRKL